MDEKQYDETVEEETTENSNEEEQSNETEYDESESNEEELREETETEEVDWKARAIKAEKAIEKAKKKQKSEPKESVEELTLARLEARGILEEDDQQFILKYAKVEGIDPVKAVGDDFVQERIKANERKRRSAAAAPEGNNRAQGKQDEVAVWVKKYKQNGALPDNNPSLTAKVLRALKSGA